MNLAPLKSIEAKAFVPSRDFELSKRYYLAIGFTMEWTSTDLACFRHGSSAFLLQDFFEPVLAKTFQMHLLVEDVDDWHRFVEAASKPFGVKITPVEDRPWGMRDFAVMDPSGVLWRIGQALVKAP